MTFVSYIWHIILKPCEVYTSSALRPISIDGTDEARMNGKIKGILAKYDARCIFILASLHIFILASVPRPLHIYLPSLILVHTTCNYWQITVFKLSEYLVYLDFFKSLSLISTFLMKLKLIYTKLHIWYVFV